MTTKFSGHRDELAGQLEPLVERLQERLDANGEANVTAYDLLLEVVIKMALPHQNRSEFAHVLREYSKMVAGDSLSVAMALDEMPKLE